MAPVGFQSLSYASLAALLLPLILFYFLKLKRPRREISSLVLWRQVMQDHRVNAPFQRFRRNLLLLLQIILLLLLVLAAMQPFWRGGAGGRRHLPVLVDCSASMDARDRPGGLTRLEEVKQRLRTLIDGLGADQELCVVAFDRAPRRLCGFTNNKRVLREALERLQVAPVPGNLEDALRLMQGLARAEPFEEVMLYSDGNLLPRVNVDLSFVLNYQRVPPGGANLGITALAARRATDGGWNLFAQIEGTPATEGSATVELLIEGEVAGRERVLVTRGRAQRLVFHAGGERAARVQVRLAPDESDALALDNHAELDLPAMRTLRVFVPPELATYRRALAGLAGVDVQPEGTNDVASGAFDLVISDRPRDAALAARTRMSVGLVPPELARMMTVVTNGNQVVDWRHEAALWQHVQLDDLVILEQPVWQGEATESDLEQLGYTVLAYGRDGPLVLRRQEGASLSYAFLFHTDRSTLPYRVGFPILVANVVQAAREQAGLAEVQGTRSLLSSHETSLVARERLEFNEKLAVAAAAAPLKVDRVLWPALVLAGLALMLVEWWFFQRKPGGWR